MVFKKKGTEEIAEIPNPSEEVKKEEVKKEEVKKEEVKKEEVKKEEVKKEEKEVSGADILLNHENRLREIEATLYRLKSI